MFAELCYKSCEMKYENIEIDFGTFFMLEKVGNIIKNLLKMKQNNLESCIWVTA